MAYLGHKPAVGENNSFRILDDISSFVLTFDGSSASVVGLSDETITITENNHRFITGQRVTYSNGGGGNITGLVNGQAYFVINHSKTQIKLASSASNALAGTAINLTGLGTGSSHTLTLAFDGVNTKFDPTFGNGMHDTLIKRAAQLVISINGVIQQPHDTATPTTGFGVDSLGHIIFSTAPASTDIFWGHILASNTVTFDSSDNDVDTFTGNGSTTSFTLSKIPPDNRNILVTIDGVVQYPSDAANTRSYNVSENVMTFTAAPGNGTVIQVRHIGYAGIGAGGGGGVTGFYGRTGNVSLQSTDNIVANNATFNGNVSIAQTLTYEDVTDIDSVGLITARSGIKDQTLTAGHVVFAGTGGRLTGENELFYNTSNNNLGIGTISPQVRLDVREGSMLVDAFNTSGDHGLFFRRGFNPSSNPYNVSILAVDHSGANKDGLSVNAYDGISFCTGSNTRNERARITQTGLVGIGTLTPSKALHVDGTIFASGTTTSLDGGLRIQPNNDGTNYGGVIYGGAHNDNNHAIYMRRGADGGNNTIDINSYGMFRVFTGGALASQGERLHITSTGNIGIGTNNPSALTHIYDDTDTSTSTEQFRISGGDRTLDTFETGFRFFTQSPSANGNRHIRFTSNGNTGLEIQPIETSTGNAASDRSIFLNPSGGKVLLGSTTNRFYAAKLQVQGTSDSNYIMMHNTTAGDGNGARYSKFVYSGTQSGGETSDLAHINAAHDGSADDQKGRLEFRVNTGAQNHSPVEAIRINSSGRVAIAANVDPASILDVREENDGGQTKIMLWNTDNDNTTTQTAGLFMSPDSRAYAYAGLSVKKENADMSNNAGRDVSLVLNTTQNNSQVEAVLIRSDGKVGINSTGPSQQLTSYAASGYSILANGPSNGIGLGVNGAIVFGTKDVGSYAKGILDASELEFKVSGNAKLNIQNAASIFTGKISNSFSYTSHNANFYGGNVNTGGVRIELAHDTTTVSGNTASGAFPHHLLLSNYSGNTSADNRMCSIGFDIPTTSTHANATIAYQATAAGTGDFQFWLENGNTVYERVRFTANGRVGIKTTSPGHSLDVFGNIRSHQVTPSLYLQTTANTAESAIIRFGDAGSFQRGSIQYDFAGDSHLRFKMGGAGNNIERMTLKGLNGNLGLGETNPQNLLHIKHGTAGQDVLKIEGNPIDASTKEVSKIVFQLTQSNNQSARLAEIVSLTESNWGGGIAFNYKPRNSTPNNTTEEVFRFNHSANAATNARIVFDAYLQMGGYNNTSESFANLAVLISARDLAGSSMVSGQSDTISGYARRRLSSDGNGTFFFGPYGAFPCGDYTALFRMKVASNSSSSSMGYIDAIGNGIGLHGRNHAPNSGGVSMQITASDFTASNTYQYFALDFSKSNSAANIELRYLGFIGGITDIYIDHILVLPRLNHGHEGTLYDY